jgi:hypothetical protein
MVVNWPRPLASVTCTPRSQFWPTVLKPGADTSEYCPNEKCTALRIDSTAEASAVPLLLPDEHLDHAQRDS